MAMDTTRSMRPSWVMTMVSMSSGKLSMPSTSVLTTSRNLAKSALSAISATAVAMPSRASQRTLCRSAMPVIASSSGRQMAFSMSSAVAPG